MLIRGGGTPLGVGMGLGRFLLGTWCCCRVARLSPVVWLGEVKAIKDGVKLKIQTA